MGGLFAFLAAAACEIIDRICGPQRAQRRAYLRREAASLQALFDRAVRLSSDIDDYHHTLSQAAQGSPYRSALEGRLTHWREDLESELQAVGTSVNDLLAGT